VCYDRVLDELKDRAKWRTELVHVHLHLHDMHLASWGIRTSHDDAAPAGATARAVPGTQLVALVRIEDFERQRIDLGARLCDSGEEGGAN
jgi:hypothetical protein